MKVLLLGVGLQGKAALYDLVNSKDVNEIIAADYDFENLKKYVINRKHSKVQCKFLDANDQQNIDDLMAEKPDVVIDLLPVYFSEKIALSAIKHKLNLVNTVYASKTILEITEEAVQAGIIILPEFGMDPGIDLVLLGEATKGMEKIEVINSYGAGIPELTATNNPLKYKVTWTFEGVLRSYYRAARLIREGKIVTIKANEMFNPENIHFINVEGIGKLEAIPNGDAIKYLNTIGISEKSKVFKLIKQTGRYSMRWPGHCEFWKKLVDLHLLDEESIEVDGQKLNRRKVLAKIIEPHIQLQPNERDIVIILLEVVGIKDGQKTRVIYQIIDKRDLQTGFTAMNRTVGFTASIGAQLIGTGKIQKKGVLSPVKDIHFDTFREELAKRGISLQIITMDAK